MGGKEYKVLFPSVFPINDVCPAEFVSSTVEEGPRGT
jgi:hypothetical protein